MIDFLLNLDYGMNDSSQCKLHCQRLQKKFYNRKSKKYKIINYFIALKKWEEAWSD